MKKFRSFVIIMLSLGLVLVGGGDLLVKDGASQLKRYFGGQSVYGAVYVKGLMAPKTSFEIEYGKRVPFELYALNSDGTKEDVTSNPNTTYEIAKTSIVRFIDSKYINAGFFYGTTTITAKYGNRQLIFNVKVIDKRLYNYEGATIELSNPSPVVYIGEKTPIAVNLKLKDGRIINVTDLNKLEIGPLSDEIKYESGKLIGVSISPKLKQVVPFSVRYKDEATTINDVFLINVYERPVRLESFNTKFRLLTSEKASFRLYAVYRNNVREDITSSAGYTRAGNKLDVTKVSVSKGQMVAGSKTGDYFVRATYMGVKVDIPVKVIRRALADNYKIIKVSPTTINLKVNESITLKVNGRAAEGKQPYVLTEVSSYHSDAPDIANVFNGLVVGKKVGKTTITVQSYGQTIRIPVEVK